MTVIINGTSGIQNNATDLSYTGTLTGGTGIVNLGSGQVYKDASGNVGIGTSSPAVKLQIAAPSSSGAVSNGLAITNAGSGAGTGSSLYIGYNTTLGTYTSLSGFFDGVGTSLAFGTTPSAGGSAVAERMRIDSGGNLLVGKTSVGVGTRGVQITGNTTSAQQAWTGTNDLTTTLVNEGLGTGGSQASHLYYFNNSSTLVGYIAHTNTSTTYNTSSDYRLKNTIAPMTGALDKVALLKPCTYKWNADGSDGQGFIAHELDAVVPGCVTGEKDATREEEYEVSPAVPAVVDAEGVETTPAVEATKGTRTVPSYQGIDTSFLVATLTAAIQELKAIIDTQATRIAALEAA